MKVAPATPAVARDWMVDDPILAALIMWKNAEKPSMRFSNSGSAASGVTSRPVKPVPPVVMIDVDRRIGDPRFHTRADFLHLVGHDGAGSERVAGRLDALGQRRAGLVVGERACVRYGEHRDPERYECAGVVEPGHGVFVGRPLHERRLSAPLNVLQAATEPFLNPVMNQRLRCSEVPWVKLSGTTCPGLLLQPVVADRGCGP